VKGTVAEHAPIVPISAQQAVNIDLLIELIEKEIPCTAHDATKPAQMFIARSFDVNKPELISPSCSAVSSAAR